MKLPVTWKLPSRDEVTIDRAGEYVISLRCAGDMITFFDTDIPMLTYKLARLFPSKRRKGKK